MQTTYRFIVGSVIRRISLGASASEQKPTGGPFLPPLLSRQAFHEEYSRLYQLAREEPPSHSDPRLQHVLVYFFQNEAPKRVVERTLLEQFADRNLSYDER